MDTSHFIFSISQLKEYLIFAGFDLKKVSLPNDAELPKDFRLQIPKYYVDQIHWYDIDDPLRKIVLTSVEESDLKEYEMVDPIGDESHSPVPGIVHRYPDRCLLMLTNMCAMHCRFCFRRNMLEHNQARFEDCMRYIEQHQELWEVILSGGDPFTLTPIFLETIVSRLNKVDHLKVIRFHTRAPAASPNLISDDFLAELKKIEKQCIVVLHINHPREITKEFVGLMGKLKECGVMLLSQTVLLKGVNNDAETLSELFKGLVEIGVKPYYLHHLDLAVGTHHFRVSVEEGKKIVQQLRGNISGVCLPEYVIDTPGGYGKIPVFWFQHTGGHKYQATSFEGTDIQYVDPS